jgi:SAM-dependent methyltransferase
MAELTQAEVGARGLENVTVAQGGAERPDFVDGSFDAVLASLVMFILPDAAAAVRRYAALLGPGGRFGFTTFGAQDPSFDAATRGARPSCQAACRPGVSGRAFSGHARGSPSS